MFNLSPECVMTKINKVIAYVDDIVIIAKTWEIMENILNQIVEEGNMLRLLDQVKTKIIRLNNKITSKSIKIVIHEFK